MTRHKHADVIHAWADGAEIQYRRYVEEQWLDARHPRFNAEFEYRIRPKNVRKEGWVNIGSFDPTGRYLGATIFDSKESALLNKPLTWVSTIKIEWEETE